MKFSENDHQISLRKPAKFQADIISSLHLKRPAEVQFCALFCDRMIFSEILDGCKFCIIRDRNFKFSGNAQLLVRCSAHRKEHLTCALWLEWECHENVKNSFLCESLIFAFCFAGTRF